VGYRARLPFIPVSYKNITCGFEPHEGGVLPSTGTNFVGSPQGDARV